MFNYDIGIAFGPPANELNEMMTKDAEVLEPERRKKIVKVCKSAVKRLVKAMAYVKKIFG